jgi:hypothetical protein
MRTKKKKKKMAKKVKYDFNPLKDIGARLKSNEKKKLLNQISDFVLGSIQNDMDSQKSSVTGSKWRKLSKDYAAKKGSSKADLQLKGDLRDSLVVDILKGNTLRAEFGSDQQRKADGHNNFSGSSNLPRRQSIPDASRNQRFRPAIRDGIADIVNSFLEDREDG